MSKPIFAEDLENRLNTKLIAKKIFTFETLTSTNDFAKRLARNNGHEGSLVLTNAQTKGRGRQGRNWYAPPNSGLWFSSILKPDHPVQKFGIVSLLAAVALASTIEQVTSLKPTLKWPNDVLINSKKVSGILIETQFSNDQHTLLILGIGVNVNQKKADFPEEIRNIATSLQLELSRPLNRIDFLVDLLHNLEYFYFEFNNGNTDLIIDTWKQRCPFLDKYVSVNQGENEIGGRFKDLDEYGRMVLRLDNGEIKHLSTGEPNLIQRKEGCFS